MIDLIINNKNALQEWGVMMGDNFIDNILSPAPLKEFIENESGLEDGKRVISSSPKLADRDVSLTFTIQGDNESDYIAKYKSFVSELQKGEMVIMVPVLGSEIYRLIYKKSTGFAQNSLRTFSKLIVSFNEPNPANRNNGIK